MTYCDPDELTYLDYVTPMLGEHPLLVDIGANLGDFTHYFLERHPGGKSICYEPILELCAELRRKYGSDHRVDIHCMGIHILNMPMDFHVVADLPVLSSIHYRPEIYPAHQMIKRVVQMAKLDYMYFHDHAYKGKTIDYLKIDTEGNEYNVLLGAETLLHEHRIQYLQFEYGGCFKDAGAKLGDVCDLLNHHGYSVWDIQGREITSKVVEETYNYSNFYAEVR